MNPHIDPYLTVWGWEIPLYLLIGGLVAGILFFSTPFFIRGKSEEYSTTIKKVSLLAGPLLALGLSAFFLDLSHKLYVWRVEDRFLRGARPIIVKILHF